jgi:hypothetical protein
MVNAPGLLQDFLSNTDMEESRALLDGLLAEHALPVVQRIVCSRVFPRKKTRQ